MEAGPLKQSSDGLAPGQDPARPLPSHPPLWAQRLLLVIEVSIAVWAGMLVILLPWTRLWSENPLLSAWPTAKLIVTHSFVRGMISGVGLVDVWMGIADAMRYRDLR